ncbi:neuropeptide Y receptor type 1-like [Ptychodera flava]|uniref:neuropeptide Y receptor type 1-like n=1 Tax=Ptychodera flava TaxID=63121 RepID=UPI00396A3CEE
MAQNSTEMDVSAIITISVGIPLALFAIIANILTCVIISSRKYLRTPTNIFILNMCIFDCVLAAVFTPARFQASYLIESVIGNNICKTFAFVPMFCIVGSIFTLTTISYERLRHTVYPFNKKMTMSTATKVVMAIWIFALGISLPRIYEYAYDDVSATIADNVTYFHGMLCTATTATVLFRVAYASSLCILGFVLPLIVITVNYFRIIRALRINRRRVSDQTSKQQAANNKRTSIISLVGHKSEAVEKMLITVTTIFVLLYTPFFIFTIFEDVFGWRGQTAKSALMMTLKDFLALLTTVYNPPVYYWGNSNFRRGYKEVLGTNKYRCKCYICCYCCCYCCIQTKKSVRDRTPIHKINIIHDQNRIKVGFNIQGGAADGKKNRRPRVVLDVDNHEQRTHVTEAEPTDVHHVTCTINKDEPGPRDLSGAKTIEQTADTNDKLDQELLKLIRAGDLQAYLEKRFRAQPLNLRSQQRTNEVFGKVAADDREAHQHSSYHSHVTSQSHR